MKASVAARLLVDTTTRGGRIARVQFAEHLLRRLRQHQVGRLQQHFVLRADSISSRRPLRCDAPTPAWPSRCFVRQVGDELAPRPPPARLGAGARATSAASPASRGTSLRRAPAARSPALRQRRHAVGAAAGGRRRPVRSTGTLRAIVPERIEVGRHVARHRAGHQQVAVAEVVVGVPVVIVVLVVAPAGDADRAVDQQQLGVHALVELAPAAGRGQHVLRVADPRAAQHRVVDAQLEVAVRAGQRGQRSTRSSADSWSISTRTRTPRRAAASNSSSTSWPASSSSKM